jgi:uncharacterized protein (DUF2062 family)
MPRKTIKKIMPHPRHITENRILKMLGPILQDPGIWHINRRSVSGAIALGLFCCFIPLPIQMWIAALGAILFRVNILIAVPTVWITNPITIPPMFYFCYLVGTWILNTPPSDFQFELSFDWFGHELAHIWQPFLLGCFIVASVSATLGFLLVRALWRYQIVKHVRNRKSRSNGNA